MAASIAALGSSSRKRYLLRLAVSAALISMNSALVDTRSTRIGRHRDRPDFDRIDQPVADAVERIEIDDRRQSDGFVD